MSTVLSCTYSGPFVVVRSWFVRSRDLLNTDFGKYFLFIYLINGSNSLTFLSSKLLTLRFITLLLTVSNNTKYQFHIFFRKCMIFLGGTENLGLGKWSWSERELEIDRVGMKVKLATIRS